MDLAPSRRAGIAGNSGRVGMAAVSMAKPEGKRAGSVASGDSVERQV
jgi:hypothetical protein